MVQTTITQVTHSFEETRNFGKEFAARFHLNQGGTLTGNVIALYGDLGAGKTTFTQGFAEGLGIKQRIISPTFMIVRKYQIPRHSGDSKRSVEDSRIRSWTSQDDSSRNFYHIDLYRTETQKDIEGLGIQEVLSDPQNIVVIEWAKKMEDLLPKKRWDIYMDYIDEQSRKIKIDFASS